MEATISSLIYTKARRLTDLFPPALRKVWKEWELRVLVFVSLVLQVTLILLGNRRKFTSRPWLRIFLWCAYLMADWVATVALGVLSNNLGDVIESIGKNGSLDANTELTAFWAPFLLLHLGGPDTITAYAMEDNELWLRHFLGLGVQTAIALYIFIMAWTGSHLSFLTFPMILAGLIKYAERTWVLRSASNEQFRDSMLTDPEAGPNYPKFMQEFTLRQHEGYYVRAEEMNEAQVQLDVAPIDTTTIADANELIKAYELFKTFKRLFVDLILSFQDRENSQSLFKGMSFIDAFKVVEIELGFMFDVLYTKATIVFRVRGCILRFISLSFTCIALVLFSVFVVDKHRFSNIDLVLTFLLLAVAVVLETIAILLLISSDWTDIYLSKNANRAVSKAISFLQLRMLRHRRWSNSLAQYSLLSVSLKTKPAVCEGIQRVFCIDKDLEKHRYETSKQVSLDLKSHLFDYLMMKLSVPEKEGPGNDKEKSSSRRDLKGQSLVLEKFDHPELKWSTDMVEFDQGILIWHIATYICYHADSEENSDSISACTKFSKQLSKYMLYLLVMHPSMMPMGIGNIRYRDTCAEATKFFEERKSFLDDSPPKSYISEKFGACWMCCCRKEKIIFEKRQACKMLLKVNTAVLPAKVKGDRSKSVLFDACKLASELQQILNKEKKWEMVCHVWVEMLAYAASQCRGVYHAQQLRRGGELLTHVWLLMSHLGLTEQFQISRGHARAKLFMD
ncbi:uncharacterized protein LOC8270919 isoform X1 [Ricinus communis]|uniref:uncharacterized protein LOC8270919 isoform X1 n=1 Tax=Ricinus communis TaxID=3988 RepID=UPI00201AD609|nr:uncharacterized protein LOC8270919 isoform X1 [Ricinus communis]